jgi:hypothetical protein
LETKPHRYLDTLNIWKTTELKKKLVDVKKEWSSTSTTQYVFMTWFLISTRDSCALLLEIENS